MVEELDLETYLCIFPNEFRIYLFNKKNLKNLYIDKIKFNNTNYIDFDQLDKFLDVPKTKVSPGGTVTSLITVLTLTGL